MQDAAFWDRIAPRYARSPIRNQAAYEATLDRVRALLKPGDSVLEMGCGTGSTALRLAGQVRRYEATDVSAGMIGIAREKPEAARTPNLAFRVGDTGAAEVAAGSLDAVLAFNLLHLVRDLDAAARRAADLLAPGGLYITKTPCLGDMSVLVRLLLPMLRAVGKAPFVRVFRREELEAAMRRAGLEILTSETFGGAKAVRFVVARKV